MHCKVPDCPGIAAGYFAKVPVCKEHQEDLADEAILFYDYKIKERILFESIRHLTPWKPVEPGDQKTVTVAGMKNGKITSLKLGNDKFVIDRRDYYKGVKLL